MEATSGWGDCGVRSRPAGGRPPQSSGHFHSQRVRASGTENVKGGPEEVNLCEYCLQKGRGIPSGLWWRGRAGPCHCKGHPHCEQPVPVSVEGLPGPCLCLHSFPERWRLSCPWDQPAFIIPDRKLTLVISLVRDKADCLTTPFLNLPMSGDISYLTHKF